MIPFTVAHQLPVGTQGYTAPEVLKGQHYSTPADVFSFAIVMSEVLSLQPPYTDMMAGEGGASLPQIVEMTKPPTNLRPTVRLCCERRLKKNRGRY